MAADLADAQITIKVGYYEARALLSAARQELRVVRKKAERSEFQPAPGHQDINAARIRTLVAVVEKVDTALSDGIAAHKEASYAQD